MVYRIATRLVIIVSLFTVLSARNRRMPARHSGIREKRILDALFESGYYDKRIRPPGTETEDYPTTVRVDMFITDITKIDDINMEFNCEMNLIQMWTDKRLEYGDNNGRIKFISLTDASKIWTPDLFFPNAKQAQMHSILKPNIILRIYPNGIITYTTRLSLLLSCPMDLRNYPFDTQICSIETTSYGFTTEDIVVLWKTENPVEIGKRLNLQGFTLETYFTGYCTTQTSTGEYGCVKLEFKFVRESNYYFTQIYIPCMMLVFVSWVSFWLDTKAVSLRVLIVLATLLTMAIQSYWINARLPPVSYSKAIDVWTGICLTFLFIALLESTLVNYISRNEDHKNEINLYRYDIQQTSALEADNIENDPESIGMKPMSTEVKNKEIKEC